MSDEQESRRHERWAWLRFSIVGPLLAAPPARGQLQAEIAKLAAKEWRHPISGQPTRFSFCTIERWYYRALATKNDPVGTLQRFLESPNVGRDSRSIEDLRIVFCAETSRSQRQGGLPGGTPIGSSPRPSIH